MTMFMFAVVLALTVGAFNAQSVNGGFGNNEEPVSLISYVNENNDDGSFHVSYESSDGIKVQSSGSQKQIGPKPENVGTVSRGSYSYTAPDGTPITVDWVADENGFQPTGKHLPTPPPMPEHVVKMLADLKKKEQQSSGSAGTNIRPNGNRQA